MPATMTIELKGLRFFAQHGWHPEESLLQNEFEVSIIATFLPADNIRYIEDTLDYTNLYDIAKTVFAETEPLLETVAQKIVAAIEAEYRQIERIQITITKLQPPIVSFTGTVGITYTKDFR